VIITLKDWIHLHLTCSVLGPLTSQVEVSVFMGDTVCDLEVVPRLASIRVKDKGDILCLVSSWGNELCSGNFC